MSKLIEAAEENNAEGVRKLLEAGKAKQQEYIWRNHANRGGAKKLGRVHQVASRIRC